MPVEWTRRLRLLLAATNKAFVIYVTTVLYSTEHRPLLTPSEQKRLIDVITNIISIEFIYFALTLVNLGKKYMLNIM